MKPLYRQVHSNKVFLLIFGTILVYIFILAIASNLYWVPVVIFILLALEMINFTTLSVDITTQNIEIRAGVGILRRTIPLRDIANMRLVTNTWIEGSGIRWTRGGMYYNAGNREAVEIEMCNGSTIRIGSEKPEALAKAIEDALMLHRH